ncbi:DNA translocase FtsK [Cohaesibacter sp. CAU 1516]|uniref:DNA translocase FtsK n=1 Tax=Cohaesibacter sp. CAU 1516 TaxID=2576038 RepID=UPI0010FEAB7A|nr:DNA translocase FtsK [Cohaesibacter sp. CAU 1516]TLP46957.1 DNA translocase FtsK [Cohaesibacter sp. CAU 1516]
MKRRAKDGALRHALRRNTYAATGLLGLILLVAIAASLVTWHVGDPSLSNATEHSPRNVMGLGGAILSDLLIQAFGLATAFLLIPPALWFVRLVRLQPMGLSRNKVMAWFGGLGMLSIAFSAIPAPSGWPLPLSLGGMIGDSFLTILGKINTGLMQGPTAVAIGLVAALLGIALLLNASNLSLKALMFRRTQRPVTAAPDDAEVYDADSYDEEDDWTEDDGDDIEDVDAPHAGDLDRTKSAGARRPSILSVPLGAIGHWYLSRKANKRRAKGTMDAHQAKATKTAKPSLFARLFGEEDDGLGDLANRLEPRLDAAPAPAYQTGHPMQGPSSADLGYGGPTDFAPTHGRPMQQGDTPPPWDDEELYDPDNAAHSAPHGIATPELDRDQGQATHRAATNEGVEAKPVAAKGKTGSGKRMVKAVQGNLFTRKDDYQHPTLDFLAEPESLGPNAGLTADQLEHNARLLEGVLSDFGIRGEIIKVRPGPVVTLYELEPAPGIKSSRVIGLADDIARSMSAISARVAVIPGRNAIGIELPNARRETVFLREMLAAKDFERSKAKLPICLGKNIAGDPVVVDLARMPHVLVAGTTGSGKSVSINTTIMSLLFKHRPEECRLIMIDPKMLELSIYDGIPHLLTPVVTDPAKAVVALKWAVREMEQRYKNMSKMGVRNIDGFNKRVRDSLSKGQEVTRTIQTGFDPETGDPIYEQEALNLEPMPYIVIVVDEMADLMMVAGKDIEGAIQRLAQMARAAGIHLIMATQRPSVDVITGTIKANFPTRISFQVTSKIDSRTILGEMGAEQLLGMGDMLYMAGGGRIQRVHGPFVSDEEVEDIVRHLKMQGTPDYLEAVTEDTETDQSDSGGSSGGSDGGSDAETLYDKAVDIVIRDRKASTSYIQRRLSIGYNRAATLIEQMEQEGVIGAANHAGKREILVPEEGATM